MTPEEQLTKLLKLNQNIVFGKTIGTDPDGNCTVQSDSGMILAKSGGRISAGDCVALRTDDGQWYAVSARQSGTIEQKTIFKRKSVPSSDTSVSNVVMLFKKVTTANPTTTPPTVASTTLYVGGDRDNPEAIYDLEDGFKFAQNPTINKTGTGQDDWIVNFILVSNTDSTSYKFCAIVGGQLSEVPLTIPSNHIPYEGQGLGRGIFQNGFYTEISISKVLFILPKVFTSIVGGGESLWVDPTISLYAPGNLVPIPITQYPVNIPVTVVDELPNDPRIYNNPQFSYFSNIIPADKTNRGGYSTIFGYWTSPDLTDFVTIFTAVTGSLLVNTSGEYYPQIHGVEFGSFSVNVLNNHVNSVTYTQLESVDEYIPVVTPTESTIRVNYSDSEAIDSKVSILKTVPNILDNPIAVSANQEYSLMGYYDSNTSTKQIAFREGGGDPVYVPATAFNTPTDGSASALFSAGDARNGGNIFSSFCSPNLVANNILSVALVPSLTSSSAIAVITTSIEATSGSSTDPPVSFSIYSWNYTGIDDDMATHIIDASAYI